MFHSLKRLIHEDHGVTAVVVATTLSLMVGVTGAAVDLGVAYSAKAELQRTADAAALAAAQTMVGVGANNLAVAQPAVALATAQTMASRNPVHGAAPTLLTSDFTVGYWDASTNDFDPARTGMGLTNPADLTAARVRLRRDDVANSPISTYFLRIFGINTMSITAQSTAFLGFAGSVPPATVDLPLVVLESSIGNYDCARTLQFNDTGDQNAMWTAFSLQDGSQQDLLPYVTGEQPCPAVNVGDVYRANDGVISSLFGALADRFNAEKGADGTWRVLLPVLQTGGGNEGTVIGFCYFVISSVNGPNYHPVEFKNMLTGHLECNETIIPQSKAGGGSYGVRTSSAMMVR